MEQSSLGPVSDSLGKIQNLGQGDELQKDSVHQTYPAIESESNRVASDILVGGRVGTKQSQNRDSWRGVSGMSIDVHGKVDTQASSGAANIRLQKSTLSGNVVGGEDDLHRKNVRISELPHWQLFQSRDIKLNPRSGQGANEDGSSTQTHDFCDRVGVQAGGQAVGPEKGGSDKETMAVVNGNLLPQITVSQNAPHPGLKVHISHEAAQDKGQMSEENVKSLPPELVKSVSENITKTELEHNSSTDVGHGEFPKELSRADRGWLVPVNLSKNSGRETGVPCCTPAEQKNQTSRQFTHGRLRHRSKYRSYKYLSLAVAYLSLVAFMAALRVIQGPEMPLDENQDLIGEGHRHKRFASSMSVKSHLSRNETEECDPDAGKDQIRIMSYDAFIKGGWMVHVMIGMYTFAAIAAICDIYFVPSLEHICEDLALDADVAGATFMAAASSAPEFCTSIIGTFVQKSDVGLGAIVGSSIFNLLAIIGLCGIFAGAPVELSWYPLTRDSVFYTIAVMQMLTFMFDSKVHWYEALIMISTYVLYIMVMVYNKKIEQWCNSSDKAASRQSSLTQDLHRTTSARLEMIRARSHSRTSSHLRISASRLGHLHNIERKSGEHPAGTHTRSSTTSHQHAGPSVVRQISSEVTDSGVHGTSADPRRVAHVHGPSLEEPPAPPATEEEVEDRTSVTDPSLAVAEYENPLDFPEGCLNRVYWIVVLPVTVLHAYTIPDSRIQDTWQARFYMIPFAMCVCYLAIYSYIMVWAMSVAAWALGIPATVAGLTVLAAGTSVPDCLSSIFVARDGYGDMAVSNAIGSNVFDILLCLGVPWFITGVMEFGHDINSEGMWVAGATLLVTILYLMISLKFCNWTLTPLYGCFTLLFYMGIMAFCILVEMNIIFGIGETVSKCDTGVAAH